MKCHNSSGNEKTELTIHFDEGLWIHILSFCSISDLLQLLYSAKKFVPHVQRSLSSRSSLTLSNLLQRLPNYIGHNNQKKGRQQRAVFKLIKLVENRHILKHVEVSSLRNLTGREWLPCLLHQTSLQSLNLSGCAFLETDLLIDFLTNCITPNLRQLNLSGCVRVGRSVISAIAQHQSNLESLWLGGCSQTIKNPNIALLLRNLCKLKHLSLQALKNIKDPLLGMLPESICSLDLSSCEQLRLFSQEGAAILHMHATMLSEHQYNRPTWNNSITSRHRLRHLALDNVGTPRRGLCPGVLTYFALGRCLCEVHLAGCEQVHDWEIEALAQACGDTLTIFQMRASRIGNRSLIALATYCTVLAECDVSACFQVSDAGILALCQMKPLVIDNNDSTHPSNKRRRHRPPLKSLKIACLPELTDAAVPAISKLDGLHVLDIHECPRVTSSVLCETILKLPEIIDVNAKGIASYSTLMQQGGTIPSGLRFVNQRAVPTCSAPRQERCCSVREHSQRLNASVPLRYMYHCVDCELLPSRNRGICSCCLTKCHRGHRTFLGSWARFYCDCPFTSAGKECQAIFQ